MSRYTTLDGGESRKGNTSRDDQFDETIRRQRWHDYRQGENSIMLGQRIPASYAGVRNIDLSISLKHFQLKSGEKHSFANVFASQRMNNMCFFHLSTGVAARRLNSCFSNLSEDWYGHVNGHVIYLLRLSKNSTRQSALFSFPKRTAGFVFR